MVLENEGDSSSREEAPTPQLNQKERFASHAIREYRSFEHLQAPQTRDTSPLRAPGAHVSTIGERYHIRQTSLRPRLAPQTGDGRQSEPLMHNRCAPRVCPRICPKSKSHTRRRRTSTQLSLPLNYLLTRCDAMHKCESSMRKVACAPYENRHVTAGTRLPTRATSNPVSWGTNAAVLLGVSRPRSGYSCVCPCLGRRRAAYPRPGSL